MSEHTNPVSTGVSSKLPHSVEVISKMWWIKPTAFFFLLVFVFFLGASFNGGHERDFGGRLNHTQRSQMMNGGCPFSQGEQNIGGQNMRLEMKNADRMMNRRGVGELDVSIQGVDEIDTLNQSY